MQETVCSTPGQAPRSQHQGLTQPQEQPSAEDPCTAIPRWARAGLPQQNNMEDALFIFLVVFACLYLFLKWVFIFNRSHPVKNPALSYRFVAQPRAHCATHCTCLHPPAQPRAHWFNGFGKKRGVKQELISSMLTVDAAATCRSQAPILYPQIKRGKEKKKKRCWATGESRENHKNQCGAGNTASNNKRRNQCIQLVKEETNAEHRLLSTETGNKRMALPACSDVLQAEARSFHRGYEQLQY